jgi:hypothetical protein
VNAKRLALAIVAVFAFTWLTDYLIHGLWLMPDYTATASLWRPQSDMHHYIGWLLLAQFLWSLTFVVIYAKGFAALDCMRCASLYGFFMGVFFEANTLVAYFSQPLPGSIAMKWFVANVAQAVLAGVLVFFVYKPNAEAPQPK